MLETKNHGKQLNTVIRFFFGIFLATLCVTHSASGQTREHRETSRNKVDAFCKLIPHKKEVFVGEPIQVTLAFYVHGPLLNFGISKSPQLQGLSISKADPQTHHRRETIKNKEYEIFENRYTLIPLKTGKATLESATVDYLIRVQESTASDFFYSSVHRILQKQATSEPVSIMVKDIPPYSEKVSGVGQFSNFSIAADSSTAHTNQPIKLIASVTGTGNIGNLNDIELTVPKTCKIYRSKSTFHENPASHLPSGTKTFEFVLQCTQSGDVTIPAQRLVYFDTTDEKHKVIESEPLSLTIEQRDDEPQAAPTTQPPKDISTEEATPEKIIDIHFIDEDVPLSSSPSRELPLSIMIVIMLVCGAIILMSNPLISKKITRLRFMMQGDLSIKQALVEANKDLEAALQNHQTAQLHQIFMGVISLLVGVSRNEVREEQIEKVLACKGWNPDKIHHFILFLNQCASIPFGSEIRSSSTGSGHQELFKHARYWMLLLSQ